MRLLALLWLGWTAIAIATADPLADLEAIASRANSVESFLTTPDLAKEYGITLRRFLGERPAGCESYEKVLTDLRLLTTKAKGFAEAVWGQAPAQSIELSLGKNKLTLREAGRALHRLWNVPAADDCAMCDRTDNLVPERWVGLFQGSKLFWVFSGDEYTGLSLLLVPARRGGFRVVLAYPRGNVKGIPWEDLIKTLIRTAPGIFEGRKLATIKPPSEERLLAETFDPVTGTVIARLRDFSLEDESLSLAVAKASPRRCHASKLALGSDLLFGKSPGEPGGSTMVAKSEMEKEIEIILEGFQSQKTPGELGKIGESQKSKWKKILLGELRNNADPQLRGKAALGLGFLEQTSKKVDLPSSRGPAGWRGSSPLPPRNPKSSPSESDKPIVQGLRAALNDPSPLVRGSAGVSLSQIGAKDSAVTRALNEAVDDDNRARMPNPSLPPLSVPRARGDGSGESGSRISDNFPPEIGGRAREELIEDGERFTANAIATRARQAASLPEPARSQAFREIAQDYFRNPQPMESIEGLGQLELEGQPRFLLTSALKVLDDANCCNWKREPQTELEKAMRGKTSERRATRLPILAAADVQPAHKSPNTIVSSATPPEFMDLRAGVKCSFAAAPSVTPEWFIGVPWAAEEIWVVKRDQYYIPARPGDPDGECREAVFNREGKFSAVLMEPQKSKRNIPTVMSGLSSQGDFAHEVAYVGRGQYGPLPCEAEPRVKLVYDGLTPERVIEGGLLLAGEPTGGWDYAGLDELDTIHDRYFEGNLPGQEVNDRLNRTQLADRRERGGPILASVGTASHGSVTTDPVPALYEHAKKKLFKSRGRLYPNRVYAVKHPKLNKWVYTKTDEAAMVREPIHALVPGAVLKGNALGMPPETHYRLTEKGTWVKTKEPVLEWYWLSNEGPILYRVFYDEG